MPPSGAGAGREFIMLSLLTDVGCALKVNRIKLVGASAGAAGPGPCGAREVFSNSALNSCFSYFAL